MSALYAAKIRGRAFPQNHAIALAERPMPITGHPDSWASTRQRPLCGIQGGRTHVFLIESSENANTIAGRWRRFEVGGPNTCPRCNAAVRRGVHVGAVVAS